MKYLLSIKIRGCKFCVPVASPDREDIRKAVGPFFDDMYLHSDKYFEEFNFKEEFFKRMHVFPIGYDMGVYARERTIRDALISFIERVSDEDFSLVECRDGKDVQLEKWSPRLVADKVNPFVDPEEANLAKVKYIEDCFKYFLKHGYWFVGLFDKTQPQDMEFLRFRESWPEPVRTPNGWEWISEEGNRLEPILWFGCQIAFQGNAESWVEPNWFVKEDSYDTLAKWASYDEPSPDFEFDRCADLSIDEGFHQWLLKSYRQHAPDVRAVFKNCPINCRQVLKDHNLKETLQRLVLERQNSDSPQTWDFWPFYDD